MRAISLTQADIYKGELILVNAEHPYFENLAKPNLVPAALLTFCSNRIRQLIFRRLWKKSTDGSRLFRSVAGVL